jgi:hypothetical protein
MMADFSTESLKTRRAWNEVYQVLKENNFSLRILYRAKLAFFIDGGKKNFHDKHKPNQYMTTKPPLQKIPKGIIYRGDENKQP